MPQKGSNDLNMLLKAKVIKIRAELDIKGSLPKIRKQIDEISKLLEKKPVKLKIQLEAKSSEINRQIKKVGDTIARSKSFKPLKISVEMDVKGSAEKIKKQLKEVHKVVDDFNRRYGQQLRQMQDAQKKAKEIAGQTGAKTGNIPMNATVQNFNNIKNYVKQLSEAERQLRSKFGDGKGLFSSTQLKDAQGNLRGFIATLERANGVVERVKYDWNKDKNKFQVIDRQTATNTEKMVHKASQALADLQREIGKTGQASKTLAKEYAQLERAGMNGALTNDMVKSYQTKVRNAIEEVRVQKQLNDLKREEQKLIRDISRTTKNTQGKFKTETQSLMSNARKAKDMDAMKDVRNELGKLADKVSEYNRKQRETNAVSKQRETANRQLARYLRETHEVEGALARDNIKAVQQLAQRARTTKQMAEVQKQLNQMYKQEQSVKNRDARELALQKLQKSMLDFAKITGTSGDTINQRFEQIKRNVKGNLSQIESELRVWNRRVAENQRKVDASIANRIAGSEIKNVSKVRVRDLINSGDITALKNYLSETQKLNIATAKVATNAKGITRITATLESTGKTAKQVTYEVNALNGKLRSLGQQDVFNRNANLGLFEQLRVAMERVPIWMTAMTAFYGSIRVVQSMTNEILKLDKALTDLRRVASASISIETMFEGGVALSKELGNNIHDIMNGIAELARTYGDFNERQLLAITRTATLMSNVSELSAQDATTTLVGTMNAFNITAEESIRIVDVLNEVDNNYAISTQQLAEGLSKGASTARTFGVTLEETVGHVTAIGAVTMESGKIIGNSLKTIYSRITTVPGAIKSLNDIGVAIEDQEGRVRKVNDILEDLSIRWNDISDAQRQNLAVQLAGRYQLSRFLALMNNWQMASEATETAIHSEGSAMRENAAYMKSFEARINKLKNSWTELSSAIGDAVLSSSLLALIDGLSKLAGVAVRVTETVGALPVLFGSLFLIMNKMKVFDSFKVSVARAMESVQMSWRRASESAGASATGMQRATLMASSGFTGLRTRASAMATSVKTSFRGMLIAIKTFSAEVKLALASTLVGGAFVALGFAIEWLMKKYNEKKQAEEELIKLNKKMVDGYRSHRDGMQSMLVRYDQLNKKTKLTKDEQKELSQIQADFANQLPTTVKYIDANGKAHMKSADAIAIEVEHVKQLSKAQAELDMAKFNEKLDKQATNYGKVINKVADLNKEQERLIAENGTKQVTNPYGDYQTYTIEVVDNTKAIQENKVAVLMAEAEKTEVMKKTVKQISDQTKAYLEANNMISNIGDEQLKAVEQFVNYNEAILRSAPDEASFKKAYEGVFAVATQIGTVFSDAFDKMSKSIEDNDPQKQFKLDTLKQQLDGVAKSIPATFYELTDAQGNVVKSSDDVVNGIKEIINVTNLMSNAGVADTDALIFRLQNAGLTAEQSKGYVYRLAVEQNNLAIKSELASRGIDETTGSLESLNEEAMEAIDLTATLFGYNGTELEGLKSHIQAMHLLIDTQGEAAKQSEAYLTSQKAVSDFLGITADELDKNKEKYYNIIEALSNLKLNEYDMSMSWKSFVEKSDLTPNQKKILEAWNGTKDIITGAVTGLSQEVKPPVEEVKKSVSNIFDDVDLKLPEVDLTSIKGSKYYIETEVNNMKGTISTLLGKIGEFKIDVNTPTGVAMFDTLLDQLAVTDGKIDETDTNIYVLRQVLNTAIQNPELLSSINQGLDNTSSKIGITKQNFGSLNDLLGQTNTSSPLLSNASNDLDKTKKKMEETSKTWSTSSTILNTPAKPKMDMTNINSGLTQLAEAQKQKEQTNKEINSVLSQGSQVSPISNDLKIVSSQADKTKKKIEKLNRSLGTIGNDFSSGRVREEIGKIGKKLEEMVGKVRTLGTSLGSMGGLSIGILPEYNNQIASLASKLAHATKNAKANASAQTGVVNAFKNVVATTKAYNSAIVASGGSMGMTYDKLAKSIASATAIMVREYGRNSNAVRAMVKAVDKQLREMNGDFKRASASSVNEISSMVKKMHKVFKSGMNAIVNTASSVPARIGKAIRDNMSSASSSMDAVARDMVKRFKKELGIHSPSRVFEDLGYWTIKGLSNGLTGTDLKSLGKDVFDDFGGGIFSSWDMIKAYLSGDFSSLAPNGGGGGSASSWKPMIMQAARQMGENLTDRELNGIVAQIQRESSGNQSIVQSPKVKDVNTLNGNPARGLLQYIPQTFNSYKVSGHGNIYSGYDQLLAFFNNKTWRTDLPYGTRGWSPRGGRKFAKGGFIEEEINDATIGEAGDEVIIPLEQYRDRALELWSEAGKRLGVDPEWVKVLKSNLERGKGGVAHSGGSFGAFSGEGGGESGGGDSGTSGILQPSIYAGLRSAEGNYDFVSLATKKKSSSSKKKSYSNKTKKKANPREGIQEAFKFDKYERLLDGIETSISLIETKMDAMNKSTLKYRDSLKQVVSLNNKHLSTMKKSLSVTEKRQKTIKKELKKLPSLGKQTTKQRDTYNKLMQEYDNNLQKINGLKTEIARSTNEIKNQSFEIFTDFIDEIVTKYDGAIAKIKKRVDNTEFKIDVMGFVNPNDKKSLLNAQASKAVDLQKQQSTGINKVNSLEAQYKKVSKSKGSGSKEAKKVKEELDKAKEDVQDFTLAVLQAEKEIKDIRADIADDGIKVLKDYYSSVKEMALKAIDLEKDSLEKSHKAKMEMYDKEVEKINSVYDARIKAMDKEKDESSYQEDLNEKNTKKAELVNKIALLSRDNSLEGRKKVAELQKELNDMNKDIENFKKDRQDKVLRDQLEEQKQAQLDQISTEKETAEEKHQKQLDDLDTKKEAISKKYEDLINNDKYWADMRDKAIKGNFNTMNTELDKMKASLDNMNKGVYDSLFSGFSKLSSEVKKQLNEIYSLDVDNMLFNSKEPISDVKEAKGAKDYKMTDGKDQKNGTKITTPKQTSPAKTTTTKTPSKTTTSKNTNSKDKDSKTSSKDKTSSSSGNRKITTAVNFRKSPQYGNNVITVLSKGDKVDYIGMEKGWAKIKAKGKTGYVGKQFLQKFDTGGFTGDWAGNDGKLAMLHKKELVLNERQTSDILDTAKIMDKVTSLIPNIKKSTVNKLETAGAIITNLNYGDINVVVENGEKKKSKEIATEILKGLKKKGGAGR